MSIERRRNFGRRLEDSVLNSSDFNSLRYFYLRTKEIFIESDATTIRVLLAAGSFVLACVLWSPTQPFLRPAYLWMAWIGNEFWWGVAFMFHTIGVIWRLYDKKSRIIWALIINTYGAFIWTFAELCLTVSIGEVAPARALDWCIILASWVALYRTGLNEGKGTP